MKSPIRKRVHPDKIDNSLEKSLLLEIAPKASYIGSPEHKDGPSFAGSPRPRANASICPHNLLNQRGVINSWLQNAIRRGAVSSLDGVFPKYVWYKDGNTVYAGRLVNKTLGHYKGYPLNDNEWPTDIERYYG